MGKITRFSENQMLLKILLSINSVRKDNLKKHIWIWKVDSLLCFRLQKENVLHWRLLQKWQSIFNCYAILFLVTD